MGIIDKCGVRGDATLCIVIFIHVPHLNPVILLVNWSSNNFEFHIILQGYCR